MSEIIVPIASKNSELHKGHVYLIEKANAMGDTIIKIKPNLGAVSTYIKTGRFVDKPNKKQISSIKEQNISYTQHPFHLIDNETRKKLTKKAEGLVQIYKDQLIIPDYINRAINSIVMAWCSRQTTQNKIDTVLLGPEPIHFFFQSITKLLGPKEIVINDNLIKSAKTKIRYQGMYENIVENKKHFVYDIRNTINNIKDFYKVGNNEQLLQEINYSHKNKNWKIEDIVVYEGGIVGKRRLELTRFSIINNFTNNNSVVLEEIDQYD